MNPEGLSFSDGEMAWTSFNKAIRKWSRRNAIDGKIHPTQKPIELYDWVIRNYAQPNQKILDTHGGSMSIALAVHKANQIDKMNLSLTAIELDEDYFDKSVERIKVFKMQKTLF